MARRLLQEARAPNRSPLKGVSVKHISNVRASIALTSCCLASLYGCSAAPEEAAAGEEVTGTVASALTATISFAPSCMTPPSPQTTPLAVPQDIRRHLQISEAYTRIVASSPAFRACMTSTMARATTLGVPGRTYASGPYYACNGDPSPANVATVMSHVLSTNGTIINCDYAAIGTSRGGSAFIGDIDTMGREVLSFGNSLGALNQPENCNYNPDGAPCVSDGTYTGAANVLGHEIMHTHGYTHVGDAVWNLNNVNVGDIVGTGTSARALTLDDFCGVSPSPTPSSGIAPTAPTSTPTPGVHPTYGSGIPYEVGNCIDTVLAWSSATGRLHEDCGADFPGLNLVDSVLTGTPSTAAMHCVRDPYTGSAYTSRGGAPIPPHAPTCSLIASCRTTSVATLSCDDNANPVHLERRPSGTTLPWRRAATTSYSAGNEYRACAESLYGKACSTPTIVPRFCMPELPRFEPIPWWKWEPFTGRLARFGKVAARLGGGHVMAAPVPMSVASSYPELGQASGDLSPAFGALGVGIYNPQVGRFSSLGASTGALPPMRGTSFATVIGADGLAHLLGFGGETPNGKPIATLYDGAIHLDDKGMLTSWSAAKSGMPGARAYASATASLDGDTAYLLGGRTAQGVTGELWSYAVTSGKWTLRSAQAVSARTDAAMTIDGGTLVVFGGRDAGGKALGDVVLVDLESGQSKRLFTSIVPRANAAIVVQGGQLFVYGGQTQNGASELLDVVSLSDGKTVSQSKIGVASSFGASLDIDEDGIVTLVPGAVPNASAAGGAFVGLPGKMTFIAE